MSTVCDVCSTIFTEASLTKYEFPGVPTYEGEWSPFRRRIQRACTWIPLHRSQQSYNNGLAHGCWICESMASIIPAGTGELETSFLLVECANAGNCARLWTAYTSNATQLPAPSKSLCFDIWPVGSSQEAVKVHQAALAANTTHDTGSNGMLNLASKWLRECTTQHENCVRPCTPAWYPTRLLEIAGDAARLIVTADHDMRGPYCTLSHCWGGVTPKVMLTPESLQQLQSGLEISSLEHTYRDALLATRHLGVRYLWIDLFCIFQGDDKDSHDDWNKESVTMDQVYAGSFLNMSAANEPGTHAGCFTQTLGTHHSPSALVRWAKSVGDQSGYYEIVRADQKDADDILENLYGRSSIFSRGWITQERTLTPRMLHFANQGIVWECSSGVATQQRPYISAVNAEMSPLPLPGGLERPAAATLHSDMIKFWCRAIRTYSNAQLTYPSKDKLMAVHSISKRIADLSGDVLFFGFLSSTLPWSLCWSSDPLTRTYAPSVNSQNHRFPSWHFARTNKRILMPRGGPRFWSDGFGRRRVQYLMCLFNASNIDSTRPVAPKHLFCVGRAVRLVVKAANSSRPARTSSDASSLLHCLHLTKHAYSSVMKCTSISSEKSDSSGKFWLQFDDQCLESELRSQSWVLLPVYNSHPTHSGDIRDDGHGAGLLLQPTRCGHYVRKGVFRSDVCREAGSSYNILIEAMKHTKPQALILV